MTALFVNHAVFMIYIQDASFSLCEMNGVLGVLKTFEGISTYVKAIRSRFT